MARVFETTVYQFDELSDKAKEKARQWWRECETEDFDIEFMFDDFVRMGRLIGIEIDTHPVKLMGGGTRHDPTIYYSGFWSQGDGACFEGRYSYAKGAVKALVKETCGSEHELIQIARDLQAVQRKHFYRLEAIVKHSGHYYHAYSTDIDVFDREDNYRDLPVEDVEAVRESLRDFMNWMYRSLEKEYEYRMADEQVDEAIKCNEYEFDEDGRRAP